MDLNDPRRRLRVLNQSSPSLRTAAAPKVTIAQPKQRLFVGSTEIKADPNSRATITSPEEMRRSVDPRRDQALGLVTQFLGGQARNIAKTPSLVEFLQPALPKSWDDNARDIAERNKAWAEKTFSNRQVYDKMFAQNDGRILPKDLDPVDINEETKKGGHYGGILSGVTDVASLGLGLAKSAPGIIKNIKNIPTFLRTAREAVTGLPQAIRGIGQVAREAETVAQNADEVSTFLAKTQDVGQIIDKVNELLPNSDPGEIADISKFVAASDDPVAIQSIIKEVKQNASIAGDARTDIAKASDNLDNVRFTDAGMNAKKAAKNPVLATHTTGESSDALTTIIQAFTKMDDPTDVRVVLGDLLPDLSVGQRKRIAGKITTADTEEDIAKILTGADDISPAIKATPEDLAANTQKLTEAKPVAQSEVAKEAVEELPTPATRTDVAPEAPQAESVAESVAKSADSAAEKFPDADPTTQAAIQKVMDELNNAEDAYSDVSKLRTTEKGQRIGAAKGSYESAGGGEAGFQAKLGQLKGKYSESKFSPIAADEATQTSILNTIEKSDLKDFQKLNTQNAMRKIWGATDSKPTPSDVRYIREFFGDEMADAVQEAVEAGGNNWRDKLAQVAGTPRALMATGDLSFGLRQGAKLGSRYPKEWAVAQKESVKFAKDSKYFEKAMDAIRKDDYFGLINDDMKVALTGASDAAEESFSGASLAEKIPVGGRAVKAADRAYSGAGTKLRFDVTKKIIDNYGGLDNFKKTFSKKEMQDIGEVINTLTGRGGKAGGLLEKHMNTLSTTLFAPRLWAANLNFINPLWYGRLSPPARKVALQSLGSFTTTAGTILGMAAAAGADVGWDPRSADFAKIKVGNTRYDILGGLQQNIRLAAQLITGEKINSTTGELETIEGGFGKPSRLDILQQAFENKENPLLSFATTLLKGKDFQGNDINPFTEALKRVTPLGIQGTIETAKDTGSIAKGVAMNAPSFFGVGTQTYGNVKSKDVDKDGNFKGKIEENMVTNDGKVMLDEKGRPVTVKFPDNASDLTKKTMLDNARDTALREEYRNKLSDEDKELLKLTKDERQAYLDNGDINKDKFDQLERYEQELNNLDGVDVPKEVTSDVAKNFYRKYNSMTKTDQENWLNSDADDNSKNITKALNKERPEGLPKYKASNRLAQLYSKLEEDLNKKDISKYDKEDKVKNFHKDAMKLQYSKEQNEIYSQNIGDIRSMLSRKKIKTADLNKAVELDNYLYNAGLSSRLKFSKTFRREYGYSLPSGGGGGYARGFTRGGGKSGSGGSEVRAYLSALLPSFSTSTKTAKPKISAVSRMPQFKSSVKSTGKSGKKATIKL